MYFRNFVNISPWKRAGTFIWKDLNTLCQDWLKLVEWFWRTFSSKHIRYFVIISPWKRVGTKLNPYTQGCVVSNLVEISFNFLISSILNYLPLENGGTLHLNKLQSLSPRNALCQVWLKLGQLFFEKTKIIKVCRQTNVQTDIQTNDERQVIRKANLGFQLRWGKTKTRISRKSINRQVKNTSRFQKSTHWW